MTMIITQYIQYIYNIDRNRNSSWCFKHRWPCDSQADSQSPGEQTVATWDQNSDLLLIQNSF